MQDSSGRRSEQNAPTRHVSKLLESDYTSELMVPGYANVQKLRAEVCRFFGWTDPEAANDQAALQTFVERRTDPLRLH